MKKLSTLFATALLSAFIFQAANASDAAEAAKGEAEAAAAEVKSPADAATMDAAKATMDAPKEAAEESAVEMTEKTKEAK